MQLLQKVILELDWLDGRVVMQRPAKPCTPVRFGFSLQTMKISIIGSGYVGLVTGACFADLGNNVVCIDNDTDKIKDLSIGKVPFFEPQLEEIVAKCTKRGNLRFSDNFLDIESTSIIFVCVDTPTIAGKPYIKNFNSALNSVLKYANKNALVVTKSTIPLGTNKKLAKKIKKHNQRNGTSIQIASNPEFLKEGSAIKDFFNPDRIIIGTNHRNSEKRLRNLYAPLTGSKNKIIIMSMESAELTKYAANSFLATKISFINEISQISEKTGANIHDVRKGIGTDPRIGKSFIYAGLGFGGSCFPKDLEALKYTKKEFKIPQGIIEKTISNNNLQLNFFLEKILSKYKQRLKNQNFAVWGLTFKPETDDLRESVSIKLIKKLSPLVKKIYLYDPKASHEKVLDQLGNKKNIIFTQNKYDAIKDSKNLVLAMNGKSFGNLILVD